MKESQLMPLVVAGSVLITVFAFFLIGFLVVYRNRQARTRRILAEYQNRLLKTQIEVHEVTARSISAELHDNVGAMLSHIKMQLQFLTETENVRDLGNELAPLCNDLGAAITDLRSISHNLNGTMIGHIGLEEALAKEVACVSRRGRMQAVLQWEGAPALSGEQELLLFRIAQEAVANAVKHSGGTLLLIALRQEAETLIFSISDDGCGVKGKKLSGESGMGMISMAERAKMLGGDLRTDTSKKGTAVIVEVPLNQKANRTKA